MKAFCLFEQSGTFKNELIKLGIPAEDFDIQNEFGETDHVVDLYKEIRGGMMASHLSLTDLSQMILSLPFSLAQGLRIRYSLTYVVKHLNKRIGQQSKGSDIQCNCMRSFLITMS